jgi:S-methylmethionine-dependent homocysteine/selenocysteine methylase
MSSPIVRLQALMPNQSAVATAAGALAEAGADLIALEMIAAKGYGRAGVQAAAETGLPVWLGITPARREDGSLGTPPARSQDAS